MFKRKLTALQFHNANAFDASGGYLDVINVNKTQTHKTTYIPYYRLPAPLCRCR